MSSKHSPSRSVILTKPTGPSFPSRPWSQWRFINRDAEGNEYAFHGVYHQVLAPERIIDTFEFEGLPETGHVALEMMKLEELPGGRTKLITQSVFQSVAECDGTLQSGMQEGAIMMADNHKENIPAVPDGKFSPDRVSFHQHLVNWSSPMSRLARTSLARKPTFLTRVSGILLCY